MDWESCGSQHVIQSSGLTLHPTTREHHPLLRQCATHHHSVDENARITETHCLSVPSKRLVGGRSETIRLYFAYCGQLYRIGRLSMIQLLLGWLKSILRIGILDFLSKIGLKAALGILVTVVAVVAGLFLIVGLLVGLIF